MRRNAYVLCALLVAFPLAASAELIGFRFEGEVIVSGLSAGRFVSGDFFYETLIPDTHPSPEVGSYDQRDVPGARLRYFSGSTSGQLKIETITITDAPRGLSDTFQMTGFRNSELGADRLLFNLADGTRTVFSNDSLPVSLALGDFDSDNFNETFFQIHRAGPVFSEDLLSTITSIEQVPVAAVPLPSPILLLASAIALSVCLSSRRATKEA